MQAVTICLCSLFVLGTFYRSASLYHPQRRAILHLKSQKRKIKNKDKEKSKIQDDRPPYFDFLPLRSKTVKLLLASIALGSFGLFTPVFLMVSTANSFSLKLNAMLTNSLYPFRSLKLFQKGWATTMQSGCRFTSARPGSWDVAFLGQSSSTIQKSVRFPNSIFVRRRISFVHLQYWYSQQ